ncbi:RAMP superfamily CRISPR-associated protein [Streptomyces sp. NBC_01808]|uniref:RAMP superfamily CRISPR-associated protein n=1 Tax=Streptomyces sp. NBC_01808 TaxID=2975947 RepID=UPI002DD9C00E|nr:RAMP superfamily CRISPR-associated protein [Streptomyces sp. NBC_01808]WSA36797.1 RAMP superfamily CRISPR-associated protein [Streptomyces sp. NBC_01808]
MRVTITFHGPFRVATGRSRPGIDAAVDPDELLPASSLKGLMRDSAERLLPGAKGIADAVFGTARHPSAWAWEGASFPDPPPRIRVRAQVSLDEETGAAKHGHLLYGEEVWARAAEFTVYRHTRLPRVAGPELGESDHLTVLACAAAGVHALGGGRRRGLGWVTCTPREPAVDPELIDRFRLLAARWREHA